MLAAAQLQRPPAVPRPPFKSVPPPAAQRAVQQRAQRHAAPAASCQQGPVLWATSGKSSNAAADLITDGSPLEPDYTIGQQIGRGSFAVVLEAVDMRTGARVAAKKLPRFVHGRLPQQQAELVGCEAAMQRELAACSPAVLRLVDVRVDDNYWYLFSELCLTDLSRYMSQRGGAPLSQREVAHIMRQLLSALAACHRHNIAFRDVKPANLLVRAINADGLPDCALADFGCCCSTADPQPSARSSAGTPLYSAPECVHGGGGVESDVWSAGVLLFHLLSGAFPFCDLRVKISQGEYWRRVAKAPIRTSGPAWNGVSPGAVALVRRMLDRDCSSRITAEQALQDPWILDMTSSHTADWQRAAAPAGPAFAERVVGNVVPGLPLHSTSGAVAQPAAV